MKENQHRIVSFDDEPLILVDQSDSIIGYKDKRACHNAAGQLHRAFSVFLFDDRGRILLQKRSALKRLWPKFWSNSCCSHPRRGESVDDAAHRRTFEELGVRTQLHFCFKFIYQAPYDDAGGEYEMCSVYVGRLQGSFSVNANEVEATEWIDADVLDQRIEKIPAEYTPWLKMEWPRLRREHAKILAHVIAEPSV